VHLGDEILIGHAGQIDVVIGHDASVFHDAGDFYIMEDVGSSRSTAGHPLHPALAARLDRMCFEVFPTGAVVEHALSLPPGANVSVTCSPQSGIGSTLAAAAQLLELGHSVVPHLSARMVDSAGHLSSLAQWLAGHGVGEVLVIGGDGAEARGPYPDALSLIAALLDSGAPIDAVGISGYPDGHALIPEPRLTEALLEKQALLDAAGRRGWVSTQLCLDPATVRRWLVDVRRQGLHLPVHLGVPGAVSKTKLLAMGMRLGIGASLRYLRGNRASVGRLVAPGRYDPMQLLAPLAADFGQLAIARLHVFTFNQVEATEAWRRAALG
jgi:methylenetetrahydrofolate reductase (NADPH)